MLQKSSKWDKIKQTLATFDRTEFEKAAASPQASTAKDTPVPSGRTTLILDPAAKAVIATRLPASTPKTPVPPAPSPVVQEAPSPLPLLETNVSSAPVLVSPQVVVEPPVVPAQDLRPDPAPAILEQSGSSPSLSIQQAALKVKATSPKRDQSARGQLNLRIDPGLKGIFEKACEERGMNMSKVVTSMIKTWVGLSLLVFSIYAAEQPKSYSSADISSYVLKHAGYGVSSLLPRVNSSLSGRQSVFAKGTDIDSFPPLSNSRLDLRVDIPLTPYYADRAKARSELQAFIYKHLSSILAASQTVSLLDSQVKLLQTRLSYMENQVKLQLTNKTELFALEDALLKTKATLFEAQSALDQRIIELAMLCGSDWREAFQMVKQWDCRLFND